MPDTERTQAQIIALLPDNTNGEISPQDLRDFVVSAAPPHGSFSRLVAAATTIGTAGVYVKAAGTTSVGPNMKDFTMPVDGRLTYIGAPDRHFHVVVSASFTVANNNKVIGLKVAKNGTPLDPSIQRRKVATGADIGSTAVHADVILSTNDYLELYVTNETDTVSPTIDELYFFVMGMFG